MSFKKQKKKQIKQIVEKFHNVYSDISHIIETIIFVFILILDWNVLTIILIWVVKKHFKEKHPYQRYSITR